MDEATLRAPAGGPESSISDDRWDAVRGAVQGDYAEYLNRHARVGNPSDHPFGLVHQSNLRVIARVLDLTRFGEVDAVAHRYFTDRTTRSSLLADARRALGFTSAPAPPTDPDVTDVFLDIPTSRVRFTSLGRAPASTSVIDCDYGYGEYRSPSSHRTSGGYAYERSGPQSEGSLGAMMFYGCRPTQGSGLPFVQELPLDLFCATVSAFQAIGPESEVRSDWTTFAAAREARDLSSRAELRPTFEELFVLHEYGHGTDDASHVLDRVEAVTGVSRTDFVSAQFADARRRGSWSRVASGVGSITDVLYQLGDLIANLVALERGASDEVWRAMRIFNWRFILPDRPIRVPRGNAAILLGDTAQSSYEMAVLWLEQTIGSCRSAAEAPESFAAAEAAAWSQVAGRHRYERA